MTDPLLQLLACQCNQSSVIIETLECSKLQTQHSTNWLIDIFYVRLLYKIYCARLWHVPRIYDVKYCYLNFFIKSLFLCKFLRKNVDLIWDLSVTDAGKDESEYRTEPDSIILLASGWLYCHKFSSVWSVNYQFSVGNCFDCHFSVPAVVSCIMLWGRYRLSSRTPSGGGLACLH